VHAWGLSLPCACKERNRNSRRTTDEEPLMSDATAPDCKAENDDAHSDR